MKILKFICPACGCNDLVQVKEVLQKIKKVDETEEFSSIEFDKESVSVEIIGYRCSDCSLWAKKRVENNRFELIKNPSELSTWINKNYLKRM